MKDDILVHHGVKGQRWGVRRQQKRNARNAAVLNQYSKKYAKKADKTKKSIDRTQKRYDKTMAKKKTELKQYTLAKKAMDTQRDKLYKKLSVKDINKGERYVKTLDIISTPILAIPVIGSGIAGSITGGKISVVSNAMDAYAESKRKTRK